MSDAIVRIEFVQDGKTRFWNVGADSEKDNEETVRAHLKRWMPEAEFVGFTITKLDKDGGATKPTNIKSSAYWKEWYRYFWKIKLARLEKNHR